MTGPLLRMLLIAVLLAVASTHLRALELAEPVWDLEAMRGLTSVSLVVRPLTGDARKAGLEGSALQDGIALRLRREGIGLSRERPVLTAEGPGRPEIAVLRLNVDDLKCDPNPDGYHEYWLQLELMQDAQLVHHPAMRLPIQTWSREATGTQRESALAAAVRDALAAALDDFIRDYRTVNGGPAQRVPPLAAESTDGEPEGD